jgi:hypothetical protein
LRGYALVLGSLFSLEGCFVLLLPYFLVTLQCDVP